VAIQMYVGMIGRAARSNGRGMRDAQPGTASLAANRFGSASRENV
jgi:hypothetical protein